MNVKQACHILEIKTTDNIDIDFVKRQYRKLSLKYHPDKSKSLETSEKFRNITEAKCFLETFLGNNMDLDSDTDSDTDSESDTKKKIKKTVEFLLQLRIFNKIVAVAIKYAKKIDKILEKLQSIYVILDMNKTIWNISDEFLGQISHLIECVVASASATASASASSNTCQTQTFIVRPTLEDLFSDKVYRMIVDETAYYVPLWTDETTFYDVLHNEIVVWSIPQLPQNFEIDENNNIWIRYEIELINVEVKTFMKTFMVTEEMLENEIDGKIIIKGKGIARPNEYDIYDVSDRADVIFVKVDKTTERVDVI
jgi:hypothetical protein